MSLCIEDYMLNLLAGRQIINGLYNAVINARRVCEQGGKYSYKFTIDAYYSKKYSGCDLIKMDEIALCHTLEEIANNYDLYDIDLLVLALLKGRSTISGLYDTYSRAENAIANAKVLCYTFKNPYGDFANLDINCIQMNERQIVKMYKCCNCFTFNPNLIIIL